MRLIEFTFTIRNEKMTIDIDSIESIMPNVDNRYGFPNCYITMKSGLQHSCWDKYGVILERIAGKE